MTPSSTTRATRSGETAQRIVLTGRVQGLGVRPAIHRLATAHGLTGVVRNTLGGVQIEVQGDPARVESFRSRLCDALPAAAVVESITDERITPSARIGFRIEKQTLDGPLAAAVPTDIAVCSSCLAEVADASNRRHRYPLTSCASCGPRYTIIRHMPYERGDTTMAAFALCPRCRDEYEDPADRRFHAQATACDACGPGVWCADRTQRILASGDAALQTAVHALRQGRIVALKGLGGYQLLADATNEAAVCVLRERKRRPARPLAVLVASLDAARRVATLDHQESAALADPRNPIVLVEARSDSPLAAAVHPGLNTVGLLLPTTPLHALLAGDFAGPLICTSGNREGEPLAYRTDDACRDLAELCDLFLHHNRPIARPIDDSVVRVIANRPVTIRLARGFAPLRLDLPGQRPVLAVGGHQKSAAAWSNGQQAVLGPHVGDQQSIDTRQRFLEQCRDWQSVYRFEPDLLAHDLHPDYFGTRWAAEQPRPRVAVQHHHAHIVAGMIEHGWLDRAVLGVAWDGTGYGTDGSIWGGEFLLARASGFERFARLRPFRLPGGEAAIHEPWRIAVALAAEAVGTDARLEWSWPGVTPDAVTQVRQIIGKSTFSPLTTSVGRLFDAAAAIALDVSRSRFDGQPAMLLEAAADRSATGQYPLPKRRGDILQLDWRPLIRALLADKQSGVPPAAMAMRFHRGLAAALVEVCAWRPDLPVVLSGGVFQNRLLTELIAALTDRSSRPWGFPGVIPPNDGGLAAGQLAVALVN
jgi:hydrogenase maturation protein HypF